MPAAVPTPPAVSILGRDYVAVLTAWRYGSPRFNISVYDFYYALARLGGHQNRKHDKRPGWLVLWRVWMKLQAMFGRLWTYWSRMTAVVGDALPGVRVVKAFANEGKEVERFDRRSNDFMDHEWERSES